MADPPGSEFRMHNNGRIILIRGGFTHVVSTAVWKTWKCTDEKTLGCKALIIHPHSGGPPTDIIIIRPHTHGADEHSETEAQVRANSVGY